MDAPPPDGSRSAPSAPAEAGQSPAQRVAALTSLAQARTLLTQLQTQQEALLLENQQLHAAQQALAASEARLRAAEAVAGMGSYESDLVSGALYFSEGMYRLFGEAPHSFTPSPAWIDARSAPGDALEVKRILAQALADQQPYCYTRRIQRADGQWRTLESHGRVVCDAAGTAIRLEGVVEDQTAPRQAEQELRASRELLQATLDSSLDMVQVFEAVRNEQGQIVDFIWRLNNRVSEKHYGDVIGQRLLVRNPGVVEAGIFVTFKQVVETGQPDQCERHYTNEQFDGWFYQSTVKLHDGVVTTTADISARKRNEQEVLRLKDEMARRAEGKYTPIRDPRGTVRKWVGMNIDIDAQKSVEVALRQSQEQLRIALEAAELGTWDWDLTTNEVRWNVRHFTMLGLTPRPGPMTPADFARHVHADDRPGVMQRLQAAVDEHRVFEAEFRAVTAQGEERWMSGHGQATNTSADGHTLGLSGVMLDITERKHTELRLQELTASLERKVARRSRSLQQNRDLLQSVYDTTLIGMAVLHAMRDATGLIEDFAFVSVNHKLQEETGRTDLVGMRYTDAFPGIVPSGLLALMRRAVETGQPQQIEYYYPYEGFGQWYSSMYVRLEDGVVATTRNITEQKQAEQEQLKNLRLLEQSEQVAKLGSWEYELAAGALRWSAGMYRLFGLEPGTPVQPGIYLDYVAEQDRPVAERVVQALTTAPADIEETLHLRVGEKEKTVCLKAVLLRDDAGQPARLLGVDLDISQVQRLESDNLRLRLEQQRALFEAVQQTQEAERRRIAEALHNGVGQVLAATKLQLDQLPAPDKPTAPAWTAARQEASHLLVEAMRQTRALSHELVPMVLEEFGLPAALQDICKKLRGPRLRFDCHAHLEADLPPLPAPLQLALYRMAQELAQNIVKHAHGATNASLELETMPGFVMLRAEDNGPGFAPTAAERAGLGLRSIRERVALLGGILDVSTPAKAGAYVRIRIPLPAPIDA